MCDSCCHGTTTSLHVGCAHPELQVAECGVVSREDRKGVGGEGWRGRGGEGLREKMGVGHAFEQWKTSLLTENYCIVNLQIKESENNSNHITSNHISSHATEHLTAAARRCYCAVHAAQWAAVSHSEGLQVQLQSVWAVQRRARKHSSHWSWGQEDTQQVQVILKTTAEETVAHSDLLLQCAQPHSTLYLRGQVATQGTSLHMQHTSLCPLCVAPS